MLFFSSDIIFPVLRERVGYLKGEEGEHESMCKLMDDLIRDDRLDRAKRLIKNFDNLTLEDISFVVDLPLSTIEELASQIPKEA